MWQFVLLPVVALTAACNGSKDENKLMPKQAQSASKQGEVDGYIVSTAVINNDIEVPGSLAPFEETNIQPEVSGKITGIYFKEGTMVGRGSLMVKLYDGDLQAQLKKLQVQLAISKKTEERQAELLKINGISQQDYDLSLLSVKNLQADIDILQTSIAKTSLIAPFTGKAGFRNVSMGAYINPQTIITTIREVSHLKLQFTVPEKYSTKMTRGSSIHFKIDGTDEIFPASIMASENNISEDTRSMNVKATVNSQNSKLIPGAFAKVQLSLDKNQQALMIPTQAIIPQARGKKVIVYRAGLASFESVTTGVRETSMIEITSGLKVGDTILISGLLTTKPNGKVSLNLIKAAKNN